jgi:hypothetical protein
MENINGQTMMNGKGNISQDDRVMKNGSCGSNSSKYKLIKNLSFFSWSHWKLSVFESEKQ